MKKLIGLTVVLLLIFTCSLTAFAEEMPGGAFVGGEGLDIGGEPNQNDLDIGGENPDQQQIESAYREILTLSQTDKNITGVVLSPDGKQVWVEITTDDPEGAKVYAKRFIDQYGAFILITDSIEGMSGSMEAGGLDIGGMPSIGGDANPFNPFWIVAPCGIFLLGIASFLLLRKRRVAALQTVGGNVIASDSTGSNKATVAAVKNSEAAPNKGMFDSIIQRIDNDTK